MHKFITLHYAQIDLRHVKLSINKLAEDFAMTVIPI